MPDLEIPDNGYVTIKIGETTRTVDLYQAYNRLQALREKYGAAMTFTELAEFQQAVKECLVEFGFPGVSYAAALAFHNAVAAAVRALRGNEPAGLTPGSPGSTEQDPSLSPPE